MKQPVFTPNHHLSVLLLKGCTIVDYRTTLSFTNPQVIMVLLKCPKDFENRISDAGTEFTPTYILCAYYLSRGQSWEQGLWMEWVTLSTNLRNAKKIFIDSQREHRRYLSLINESVTI